MLSNSLAFKRSVASKTNVSLWCQAGPPYSRLSSSRVGACRQVGAGGKRMKQ
jgi:hypothetical protein